MNIFEHDQKLQSLHGPTLLILHIDDNVEYTMSNNHSCEIALSTHSGGTHRSCAFLSFFRTQATCRPPFGQPFRGSSPGNDVMNRNRGINENRNNWNGNRRFINHSQQITRDYFDDDGNVDFRKPMIGYILDEDDNYPEGWYRCS